MTAKIIMLVAMGPGLVEAKILYVNNSHAAASDATTYAANDINHPWRTVMRASRGNANYSSYNAAQAAQAGDTVLISAGVYWEGTGAVAIADADRYNVVLNPINSGTPGNPITFRGVGNVYLRTIQGIGGSIIGCHNRFSATDGQSYIVWDHFILEDYYQGTRADGAVVTFNGGSSHCELLNSEIIGVPHPTGYYWGYTFLHPDQAGFPGVQVPVFCCNYSGVRMDATSFAVIRNNKIHGFRPYTYPVWGPLGGGSGTLSYDSQDIVVEHNEIYDAKIGIYFKGWTGGAALEPYRHIGRYNLVYNVERGLQFEVCNTCLYHQNVVYNANSAMWSGSFGPTNSSWVNNTVDSSISCVVAKATTFINSRFNNNICVNTGTYAGQINNADSVGLPSEQSFTFNRNLYYGHGRFAYYNPWLTFPAWQAYGQDADSLDSSAPLFVDAAARNYRLQTSSPARALGRVVNDIGGTNGATIPAGAYITGSEVIGLFTSNDATAPAAPTQLRIVQ